MSLGLTLIEAINHGCKVIVNDFPYVHEIIESSLVLIYIQATVFHH